MFYHILILCMGNICRSPVAARMLQAHLPDRKVESAGLTALVDHSVDAMAASLAEASGLDTTSHKARQVTVEMIRDADLILVMSEHQRQRVSELDLASTGKTMLMGRWLPGQPSIPDPYKKGREAFEHVHTLLLNATAAWAARLK